ncbi:MAG TPA: hypothetical protein PKC21_07930 [Oligoflexia bacterium]|nr:hypothetical protein [Oligoflexia bacterium]HMR25266.1 hypothetical protein [Oligoflexia bacterium]
MKKIIQYILLVTIFILNTVFSQQNQTMSERSETDIFKGFHLIYGDLAKNRIIYPSSSGNSIVDASIRTLVQNPSNYTINHANAEVFINSKNELVVTNAKVSSLSECSGEDFLARYNYARDHREQPCRYDEENIGYLCQFSNHALERGKPVQMVDYYYVRFTNPQLYPGVDIKEKYQASEDVLWNLGMPWRTGKDIKLSIAEIVSHLQALIDNENQVSKIALFSKHENLSHNGGMKQRIWYHKAITPILRQTYEKNDVQTPLNLLLNRYAAVNVETDNNDPSDEMSGCSIHYKNTGDIIICEFEHQQLSGSISFYNGGPLERIMHRYVIQMPAKADN